MTAALRRWPSGCAPSMSRPHMTSGWPDTMQPTKATLPSSSASTACSCRTAGRSRAPLSTCKPSATLVEMYYRTLEAHLRDGHQCEHSFVDVADSLSSYDSGMHRVVST